MDYRSLKKVVFVFWIGTIVNACATHSDAIDEEKVATFKRLEMPYLQAVKLTRDSILWIQGMELKVEDLERGLLVTDWQVTSPRERHRMTLRIQREISKKGEAGLISVHAEEQILGDSGVWIDVPSSGQWENQTLTSIDQRYQTYQKARHP